MHLRIAWLTLLCLMLVAAPAWGQQILYSNGPINGTVDAWTINFGYIVSDTFTLVDKSTVGGFDLGVWEFPGDTVLSVDWSITAQEQGGHLYASGTANVTDKFISANQYGYNIDEITATGLNVPLNANTYWLNIGNAKVTNGDPVYWDENNGVGCNSPGCPSEPSQNSEGTILSESFDVTGPGTVPEPGSIVLFGSGALGMAGLLVRKLFR